MMGSLAYKKEKIRSPVLKGWMWGECEPKQRKPVGSCEYESVVY